MRAPLAAVAAAGGIALLVAAGGPLAAITASRIAPAASSPSLTVVLSSGSAASRGFWTGTARLAGATAASLAAVTYGTAGCRGAPLRTDPVPSRAAGAAGWSLRGPTPPGVTRFSTRAVASLRGGAVTSSCQDLAVSGSVVPADSVATTTDRAGRPWAVAVGAALTVTPASAAFPNNVLWSGALTLSGGANPGGSVAISDFAGGGCTGQSDWQTTVTFTSGTGLAGRRVVGYALPAAGAYSVLAQYPGDASNAPTTSACIGYTVSSQGTGDSLAVSLPGSSASPDQLMPITTQVSGLAAAAPAAVELDLDASGCWSAPLTTWTYPVSGQAGTTLATSATVPQPGSYGVRATLAPTATDSGITTTCTPLTSVAAGANSAGDYVPLRPFRVLDTRNGSGAPAAPVGQGGVISVQVAGVPGSEVPAAGASAVVLNVTVDSPTAAGFLTLWPAGLARPLVSNLNFVPAETVANLATVRLGASGQVSIFNSTGSVAVIADVLGYYSDGSTGAAARLTASAPSRILDTRTGLGSGSAAPLGAGQTLDVTVAGAGAVPASAVAVVMNVTVTATTAPSYLTVWPAGGARPTASNLNWTAGTTIPNQVVASVGDGGAVSLYNLAGRTDVVADVTGWYRLASADPAGLQYFAVTPVRELDTRTCRYVATSWATRAAGCPPSLGDGAAADALAVGSGVPAGAAAVLVNTTVTDTTAPSYLTVFPGGATRPVASSLNWTAGGTDANLVLAQLGRGADGPGEVSLYNHSGSTGVVMDASGYFQAPPPGGSTAGGPAPPAAAVPTGAEPYDWGVYIAASQAESDTFPSMSLIDAVEQASGQHMPYIMWYVKWGDTQTGAWNATAVDEVLAHGSIPQISWQSDNPDNYSDPAFSDSAIAAGSQDAYLHSWARGVRAAPGLVQLRLDYEMNGSWSQWAPGNNGNTASAFIAMWRHVHDLFASDGVTNVQWLWTPNTDFPNAIPMASLYPGDAYVDWLGMDGYNHVPFNPDGRWDSPATVFDQTLGELDAISSRPLMISEVGVAEVGGDKAAWIGQLFDYLRARPRIHNFIWFDIDKETDWRIDSSAASQAAFAAGLLGGDTPRHVACAQEVHGPGSDGQVDVLAASALGRPVRAEPLRAGC